MVLVCADARAKESLFKGRRGAQHGGIVSPLDSLISLAGDAGRSIRGTLLG
jgi:hypothetical protein